MAVAAVAEAWAPVAQFISMRVISQSKTAPSRTTERWAGMASRTFTQGGDQGTEVEEDCPETAVTDVPAEAAAWFTW